MIKRTLFNDLKAHLFHKEISLIVGPRQAGKTTLMRFLEEHLKNQKKQTLFLNLDVEIEREHFTSQSSLIKKLQLELGRSKGYVFIDEIQRKENAGIFLKGLYDANLPYKFIVSGSGSLELKEKIHESLAGRKRIFELGTLTFQEFVDYKTGYKYEKKLKEFFKIEKTKTQELLNEYLNFGGYPRVVLEEKLSEKIKIIDEIYRSYLERDIAYLLGVKKTDDFTRLVKLIAAQTGSLVNISELSSTLGSAAKTVQNFLWYLEKTFITHRLTPYFKNTRKEITKAPVFYFYDLGLRGYATGEFGRFTAPSAGFVYENFIHNVLKEKIRWTGNRLYFWRTKDGAEIDFIVEKGKELVAVEAKYSQLKKPEISRSIRSFITAHKPRRIYIVNLTLSYEETVGNTSICFIPFSAFLSLEL